MGTFSHHTYLDFSKPDALGNRVKSELIGKKYFHLKTRRVYSIESYIWNSTTDEWEVLYGRSGCKVRFTRKLAEFFNEARFLPIASDNSGTDDDD